MKITGIIPICVALMIVSGCVSIKDKKAVTAGVGHTFSDLQQHTETIDHEYENIHVDISKDGKWMAFVELTEGVGKIFIKKIGSQEIKQRTFGSAGALYPAFSPDGKRIAYATFRNGNWDIFVMSASGGRKRQQISFSTDHDIHPTWSPDGKRIAYSRFSSVSSQWEIWSYDLTNGAVTFLTPGKYPTYALEENKILFQRSNKAGFYSIWTIYETGFYEKEIVSSDQEGYVDPDWAPDGDSIVFTQTKLGLQVEQIKKPESMAPDEIISDRGLDLWMIKLDGSNLTQLTVDPNSDWAPKWATDWRIYMGSARDNSENIYSFDPEVDHVSPPETSKIIKENIK